MSVADRAFGWEIGALALYRDGPAAPVSTAQGVANLLTVYQECRLRQGPYEFIDGRATRELSSVPLPVSDQWHVEIGKVVDKTLTTVSYLRASQPFEAYWFILYDDRRYVGRVYIEECALRIGDGAQTEDVILRGIGELKTF